jgi:UDP-N-acetylglucosamine acyltransferase
MPIHPTAIVDPSARLGAGVTVGPGAIIEAHVTIGDDCEIGPRAILTGHTTLGPRCRVYPSAVIGIEPQDLSYHGEPTEVHIGSDNVLREFTTIHRGTPHGRGQTVIGDRNFLMANSHVAHDCLLGNDNILANAATLAGHAQVGDYTNIGGLSALHQFTRIGSYAFIGGCSAVSQDIPPYHLAAGNRAVVTGLNRVGLQRRGFTEELVKILTECFKLLYLRNNPLEEALRIIEERHGAVPEAQNLVGFIRGSRRGIVRYGKPN